MTIRLSSHLRRLRFYCFFILFYFLFHIIFFHALKSSKENTPKNAHEIVEIYKNLSAKLYDDAILDNSGWYKIIEAKKSRVFKLQDITIVTQCSSNHFPFLDSLFKAWEGPISVAIFSDAEHIKNTLWNMARFLYCNHERDFAMQLVVPVQDIQIRDFQFLYHVLIRAENFVSCSSAYVFPKSRKKNYDWMTPYPINLLRNIAKAQSKTDYILVIDIDMVPNLSLRRDFLNFIKTKPSDSDKVVYVVPAFEIVPGIGAPEDKTQLKKLVEIVQARPFYVVPCDKCQKLTKYDEWLSNNIAQDTEVLYEVEWKHPWEPFFIAKRNVPNFDERFRQYGMNRVSQICELHVAGYKFLVLGNAFIVHKGFKNEEDFHDSKNKEMELNRKLYSQFKIELKYKYPGSGRSC